MILERDYNGQRLQTDVLAKYSSATTDMWPYLRMRAAEVAKRKCIYAATFLSQFFARLGCPHSIAERLWTCPDRPRQLLIAVRCVRLASTSTSCCR